MFPTVYHGYIPASAQQFIETKIGDNYAKNTSKTKAKSQPAQKISQNTINTQQDLSQTQSSQRPQSTNLPKALQLFYNRNSNSAYASTFQNHTSTIQKHHTLKSQAIQSVPRSKTAQGLRGYNSPDHFKTSYQNTFSKEAISGAQRWGNVNPELKKLQLSQNRVQFSAKMSVPVSAKEYSDPISKIEATLNSNLNHGKKTTGHVTSYTGHIPKFEPNKAKAFSTTKALDPKRVGTREYIRNSININVPGYSGHQPSSSKNFISRPYSHNGKTTSEADYCTKPVNPNNAKAFGNFSTTTHEFFTLAANTSSDGLADAQKFYAKYRPLGGVPSLGAKSERDWIPTNTLKRTYIF